MRATTTNTPMTPIQMPPFTRSPASSQPVSVVASIASTKSRDNREVVMERRQKMKKMAPVAIAPVLGTLTVYGGKRLGATFAPAAAAASVAAAFLPYLV